MGNVYAPFPTEIWATSGFFTLEQRDPLWPIQKQHGDHIHRVNRQRENVFPLAVFSFQVKRRDIERVWVVCLLLSILKTCLDSFWEEPGEPSP